MEKTSRRRKYIGKHVKPTDENIMQLLMPSILGMLICMVCLVGATWAWFTATTTVSAPAVSAAWFDVNVAISDSPSNSENNISAGGSEHEYTIASNTNCTVTLTAIGNASIGGYCVVKVDGDTYYTPHMWTTVNSEENNTFSFNVCSSSGEITIVPYWGEISDNSLNIIKDNPIGKGVVDSETPDENTGGGAVNSGGAETDGNDNSAANNDNAGDQNTSPSEQLSSHPANEDKGDSSDNNGGSSSDSANTTPSTSDNSADGSHDSSSASASGSGSSDSGSGSGGNSDSSSSDGGESSGGGSGGGESSGGGSDSRGE